MSKGLFDTIDFRFKTFHEAHPEVYAQLIELARELKDIGYRHYGIKSLLEVVRWRRRTNGPDDRGFKLNNDFSSRYARLIEENEPDLAGFFEKRVLRAA